MKRKQAKYKRRLEKLEEQQEHLDLDSLSGKQSISVADIVKVI